MSTSAFLLIWTCTAATSKAGCRISLDCSADDDFAPQFFPDHSIPHFRVLQSAPVERDFAAGSIVGLLGGLVGGSVG